MSPKQILYILWARLHRCCWAVSGGRRIRAMGERFRVTPHTVFPIHRRLRLPRGGPKSDIVRYADFVQMHACCQFITSLPHSPTIVDVGAHHGAYAVVLGKLARGMGGKVLAIEPNPEAFRTLTMNVQLNGLPNTVALEQVAVTEKPSVVRLAQQDSQSFVTGASVAGTVEVRGEPLSDVVRRHALSHVDLLIIDVEGAELPVLRSFPWTTVGVGRVFCELHPYAWPKFGYGGGRLAAFLRQQGLRCLDMYLQEYNGFPERAYIGPCCLLPCKVPGEGTPGLER